MFNRLYLIFNIQRRGDEVADKRVQQYWCFLRDDRPPLHQLHSEVRTEELCHLTVTVTVTVTVSLNDMVTRLDLTEMTYLDIYMNSFVRYNRQKSRLFHEWFGYGFSLISR